MTKQASKPFSDNYFSRINTFSLDNGLGIFINPKHDAPTVSIQCFVASGSVHEANFLGCGLSHFLEHMLFQGCEGYPGQTASDTVNNLGGSVNAYTSYDHTVYYINLPSEHCEIGIDILAKMLSTPKFPKEKFLSEKDVILRERDMVRDRPENMLGEKLWKTVFTKHPVRHPIIGYHEKIEQVSRDIMFEYYHKRYSPERTFFVISGDVNTPAVLEMLDKRLSSWRHGNIYEAPLPEEPVQIGLRSNNCFFEDPLSRLAIASRIPSAAHQDIPALDMISAILGQGTSARLIKSLQHEKELAVALGAFTYAPNFSGISAISSTTTPDKLPALEAALLDELGKLRKNGVTSEELKREKNQHMANYIRILRSNNGIASIIGDTVLAYGDPAMADHYVQLLNQLTAENIKKTANKYFSEEQLCIVRQISPKGTKTKKTNKQTAKQKKAEKSILKSKARLITLADNSFPLVDICLISLGGNIIENPDNAGISRLMAKLLSTGTKNKSEEKFNAIIDDNAIDFSVSSGNNTFFIKLNCMRDKLDIAVKLLKEIFSEPAFRQKQFAREQHNTLQKLKTRAQDPNGAALDKMYELLYKGHPHALPRDGSLESITKLNPENLKDFYSKQFIASKTIIGIAGDISREESLNIGKSLDKAIPWNKTSSNNLPDRPVFPKKDIKTKIELAREQIKVIYAVPTCDYHSSDRFAFDILQQSLNGLSSKLFKNIREDKGLAYSTGAMFGSGLHPGFAAFYAATNSKSVPEVTKLLTEERKRLAEDGLNQDEFNAAQARVLFSYSSLMSNNSALLFNSMLEEFYDNGYEKPWHTPEIIRDLNLQQVNAVFKKYFTQAKGVYVIAGRKET